MLHLDLYTLSIATIGNLLLTSFAMLIFWSVNRGFKGIRCYCLANFLLAAGFLTLVAGTSITGRGVTLAAHCMLFLGALLLLNSIRVIRIFDRIPIYASVAATAVYVVLIGYWLFANDDRNARALISSPVFALISLCSACSMAVRVPARDRTVYWITAGFFTLHSISLTIRAGQIFNQSVSLDAFAISALDWMSLVTFNLAITGCAFGLSTIMSLRARRETEQMAFFDPLTCLPNRRLFEQHLETAYRRAVKSARGLALIYCDLDRFKEVNDALGHVAGDEVLRHISGRLAGAIQQSACLARIGGDEFLLLLENVCSRDEVSAIMERMKQATRKEIRIGATALVLDMSCGYAMFPDDAANAHDLIRQADAAMYKMKNRPKSSFAACSEV